MATNDASNTESLNTWFDGFEKRQFNVNGVVVSFVLMAVFSLI